MLKITTEIGQNVKVVRIVSGKDILIRLLSDGNLSYLELLCILQDYKREDIMIHTNHLLPHPILLQPLQY